MIQLADKKIYKKLRKSRSQPENHQGMSNENKPTSRQSVDAIRTILTQSKEVANVPPNVFLLDTCSDTCIVKNRKLVQDLIRDKQGIRVVSDGGGRDLYEKGKFTLCKELEVWYHEGAYANVLSYSKISKIAKIKTISNGFTMCWPSGAMGKYTTRGTHIYHYTLDGRTRLEMESDRLQQTKSFAAPTSAAANKRM